MRRTLTLGADRGFVLPELEGDELEGRFFEVTYFDTPARRLAAAEVTLRRHVENGRSRWFLELRGGEDRLEADGGPVPPSELTRPLATLVGTSELIPVASFRARRQGRVVRDNGHAVARLLADDVSILGPHRDGFGRVRIELVEGGRRDLAALRETVERAGARRNALSLEAILGLVAESEERDSDDPCETVRLALRRQRRALLRHDPGARLGFVEDVHQLRVAARRSRAYLRAARRLFQPEWTAAVQADLRWFGQGVGAVRDLDVLIERLELERAAFDEADARAAAPLLKRLRGERARARELLLATLDSERYAELLDALEQGPPNWVPPTEAPDLKVLAAKEFDRLGDVDEGARDEELHALRIRTKRVRYAAELLAPKSRRARRVVARAKRLQDVLGEHQDAAVAEQRLRGLIRPRDTGTTALVTGRLVELQHERRRAARREFPKALRKLERAGSKL